MESGTQKHLAQSFSSVQAAFPQYSTAFAKCCVKPREGRVKKGRATGPLFLLF